VLLPPGTCLIDASSSSQSCATRASRPDDRREPDAGPPPRVVDGRFVVHELIGKGGMAVVHRAIDRATGNEVALKLAHRVGPRARLRAERERAALRRLDHPNVVGLHAAGEHGGRPWLAYELIPGARSLDALWPELGRDERLARVREVALGLAHAHARGVVHRDVKPDNVLVGLDGRARLADFGLAWVRGVSGTSSRNRIVGTPRFMSPEQVRGRDPTPATDVWGLGLMLFEALTDRLPFEEDDAHELYRAILNRPAASPRALDATVPWALDRLCLAALDRDPALRPPDAGAFLAALDRALATGLRGLLEGFVARVSAVGDGPERRRAPTNRRRKLRATETASR
jgi:eukaryotic-like serine/threonine-protein kinase